MENINKEALSRLFSGVPKDKLEKAMKTAEALAKDPNVKNSFSKISDAKIRSMLSAMNDGDKLRLASLIANSDNGNVIDLIKNLK